MAEKRYIRKPAKKDHRKCSAKCIVKSCGASYRKSSKDAPVKLYSFPKKTHNLNNWLKALNLPIDLKFRKAKICVRHFEKKYVGRRKLKANAIPSLNLDTNFSDNVGDFYGTISLVDSDEEENKEIKEDEEQIENNQIETDEIDNILMETDQNEIILNENDRNANIQSESEDEDASDNFLSFKSKKKIESDIDSTPSCVNCMKKVESGVCYKSKYYDIGLELTRVQVKYFKLKEKFLELKQVCRSRGISLNAKNNLK